MATAGKNLSAYDKKDLPDGKTYKIGVAVSEWNNEITENLYKGAFEALTDNGVAIENVERWDVPGSFELIYACKKMQEQNRFDAIIAIGSVIQGETKHFDFVCQAVSQGVKELNLRGEAPVIFCLLTDNNKQQALDRSGGKHGNKGTEAAIAALKMAQLRHNAEA